MENTRVKKRRLRVPTSPHLQLMVCAYLVLAVAYGVVAPPFESPDEVGHFFTVKYIADYGQLPVPAKELSERYVDQVMAYCKMKNVRTAKIIVVHIVGGWKATNFMPRMKVWDITFTQDELDRHWSTMMARKGVLEFELEQGKVVDDYPPPYTWNCSYCQYTDQCPNSLK